jgi:hypothetical protein
MGSTRAAAVELGAGVADVAVGGSTSSSDIASAAVSTIAIGGATSELVEGAVARSASQTFASTGLDASLDASMMQSRNLMDQFGTAMGSFLGLVSATAVDPTVQDADQAIQDFIRLTNPDINEQQ